MKRQDNYEFIPNLKKNSQIHLIGILLIGISGSDQDFSLDKPLFFCHNSGLSGKKS